MDKMLNLLWKFFMSYMSNSASQAGKEYAGNAGDFWEDPLKKEMATHSSILAWRIPWKRLQSMGSQRVEHNCATFTLHV